MIPNKWSSSVPWFLTIMSTIVLIALAIFLISNIEWYKNSVFDIEEASNGTYRMRAYDIHLSMIKRSVGLFAGFATMFLGLGVAYYTIKQKTELGIISGQWTANLATASPGIIAVVVGGYLIIATIQSKDEFLPYIPATTITIPTSADSANIDWEQIEKIKENQEKTKSDTNKLNN